MKVDVREYEGAFTINLTAETMQEAATLTRMGMNSINKVSFNSYVEQNGNFSQYTRISKSKRASSTVPKRK